MEGTSVLYDFIMYFLEPFADHMSDSSFEIMLSTVGSGFLVALMSGAISAVWGACGALAALRRSKRG